MYVILYKTLTNRIQKLIAIDRMDYRKWMDELRRAKYSLISIHWRFTREVEVQIFPPSNIDDKDAAEWGIYNREARK